MIATPPVFWQRPTPSYATTSDERAQRANREVSSRRSPARPRAGTIRGWVYEQLDYLSGYTVDDLLDEGYSRQQIYDALIAMESSGIVERFPPSSGPGRRRLDERQTLWFRVGANDENNPFTLLPPPKPPPLDSNEETVRQLDIHLRES